MHVRIKLPETFNDYQDQTYVVADKFDQMSIFSDLVSLHLSWPYCMH